MSFCINPICPNPKGNHDRLLYCQACGSELLLEGLYRVQRELGGGGFGKTYELSQGDTLKVLKVLTLNHPEALRLFKQEAEVLGKLNHPGIPQVEPDGYFIFFPKDSQEPLHCIVMEKIEGENLETYLHKRGQPISQKLALKWLQQIAEILHQVHQQGFLHRDIKPPNIMIRPNGQLVLIDFGTVKEITATVMSSQAKKQGTGVYAPGYAPPEQEKGFTVLKSDFFALGRTFVHLLTNQHPLVFYDAEIDDLNWRSFVPNLSPFLGDFLDELMLRLAKDRPKDTGVILQKLGEIEKKIYPPSVLPKPKPAESIQEIESIETKLQSVEPIEPLKTEPKPPSLPPTVIKANGHSSLQRLRAKRIELIAAIIGLIAVIIGLGLGWTQYYGKVRYGVYPVNPFVLIRSLPSSPFLIKILRGHSDVISSVTISPNGKTIVSGSYDNSVKIWDLATGKLLHTLKGSFVHAISPDSKTIVGGSLDGTIKIWDLATGKLLHTLKGSFLAISPDGKTIVDRSPYDTKTIKIWDLATGKSQRTLKGHSGSVDSVAISPDSQTLVSTGWHDDINIWDLATGKLLRTFTGQRDQSVAISPDGKMIVSQHDHNTISILDLFTGKFLRSLNGDFYSVWSIAISPDGQTLVSGSDDKTIKILRLER